MQSPRAYEGRLPLFLNFDSLGLPRQLDNVAARKLYVGENRLRCLTQPVEMKRLPPVDDSRASLFAMNSTVTLLNRLSQSLVCVLSFVMLCTNVRPSMGDELIASPVDSWAANPEVVRRLSARRSSFNYDEAKAPSIMLPDPLVVPGLGRVGSAKQWKTTHRPALLKLFRQQVYGVRPDTPFELQVNVLKTLPDAFGGAAIGQSLEFVIKIDKREYEFPVALFLPKNADIEQPAPAIILINNRGFIDTDEAVSANEPLFWPAREIIAQGYATASFHTSDVDPDHRNKYAAGIRSFFADGQPPTPTAWRSLSAWGWAASRVLDHLETLEEIDATKVAIGGHSRGGKAALWAAAEDTRFAIAYSNNSGCGGAALSRRRLGETVGKITSTFPHWFNENFAKYADRENELPIDQHQLIGLVAPRGVYVTSADEDLWADPKGEYLSLASAAPIFRLLGVDSIDQPVMPPLDRQRIVGSTGYHIRSGGHNLLLDDWEMFLKFADAFFANMPQHKN